MVHSAVASVVAWPRMTSTSCMTGTGFMKCMPMTWSGRLVRAAISVIEIELVLRGEDRLGRRRSGRAPSKSANLTSGRSEAASTTTSAAGGRLEREVPGDAAQHLVGVRRGERALLDLPVEVAPDGGHAPGRVPAGRRRSAPPSQPCCAKTWAMPLPIVPAPTTAARFIPPPPPSGSSVTREEWRRSWPPTQGCRPQARRCRR